MDYEYDKLEGLDYLNTLLIALYEGKATAKDVMRLALSYPCIAELMIEELNLGNLNDSDYEYFIKMMKSITDKEESK